MNIITEITIIKSKIIAMKVRINNNKSSENLRLILPIFNLPINNEFLYENK